jgi:hypothetical protein
MGKRFLTALAVRAEQCSICSESLVLEVEGDKYCEVMKKGPSVARMCTLQQVCKSHPGGVGDGS